jgi:hypothetical protein
VELLAAGLADPPRSSPRLSPSIDHGGKRHEPLRLRDLSQRAARRTSTPPAVPSGRAVRHPPPPASPSPPSVLPPSSSPGSTAASGPVGPASAVPASTTVLTATSSRPMTTSRPARRWMQARAVGDEGGERSTRRASCSPESAASAAFAGAPSSRIHQGRDSGLDGAARAAGRLRTRSSCPGWSRRTQGPRPCTCRPRRRRRDTRSLRRCR